MLIRKPDLTDLAVRCETEGEGHEYSFVPFLCSLLVWRDKALDFRCRVEREQRDANAQAHT